MSDQRLITLLTDFGTKDVYAGVLRGVLLREAPGAVVVDLSHEVPPYAPAMAALMLGDAAGHFPDGTVHLVVVDPGVGSARRALAVRTPRAFGVGPDNGALTPLLDRAERVVAIDEAAWMRPPASRTFHGRDLFAPAAAALARGVSLESLGGSAPEPVRLRLPEAAAEGGALRGEVLHVDRFGNLITNVRGEALASWRRFEVEIAGRRVAGPAGSYAEGEPALRALVGSGGRLEIALREGDAARALGAGPGETLRVREARG